MSEDKHLPSKSQLRRLKIQREGMMLSDELKYWGYHSSISNEGKKQHLEMAERAEQLEADNGRLREASKISEEYGSVGAPEVHRVWRDVMLEQARTVGTERMDWHGLPAQDKYLDEKIASAVVLDFLIWFFAHKQALEGADNE